MEQANKNNHFCAIIRHGERADKVPNMVYKNHVDPPLTPMGMKQAETTGAYLKDYF